jgi:hypothetical protein
VLSLIVYVAIEPRRQLFAGVSIIKGGRPLIADTDSRYAGDLFLIVQRLRISIS